MIKKRIAALVVTVFTVIFLICSLIFELVFQGSISSRLLCHNLIKFMYTHVTSILNTKNITEIVRMIGIFSTLITWIYRELDKSELGVKNKDIINKSFPEFYCYTVIYVIAVVVCLCVAINNHLESTLLSFFLIIFCLCIQSIVLFHLIICPKKHLEHVIKYYEQYYKSIEISGNVESLYYQLLRYSKSFDATTIENAKCVEIFIKMGILLMKLHKEKISIACEQLKNVWRQLSHSNDNSKTNEIPLRLLIEISKNKPEENCYILFCCSFYLWMQDEDSVINYDKKMPNPKLSEKMLHNVLYYESLLTHQENLGNVLLMSYGLTAAHMFLEGVVEFQTSCEPLYGIIPETYVKYASSQKDVYCAMLNCLFNRSTSQSYDNVWNLLYAIASK